ncbi:hypothetical protein LX24_02602 [Desulfallas thermosapovorans DSM 6562]|uniref:Uncharacterized protein n=1 Tax=Desulfallas thermosapovorans DSM 6562 TaxID=1121431 RepID=A0A5S4ZN71_9FIRM|nr:hypothetical protein LX24_02602 [Desulfallas thermosapovorans DSM 6562]
MCAKPVYVYTLARLCDAYAGAQALLFGQTFSGKGRVATHADFRRITDIA